VNDGIAGPARPADSATERAAAYHAAADHGPWGPPVASAAAVLHPVAGPAGPPGPAFPHPPVVPPVAGAPGPSGPDAPEVGSGWHRLHPLSPVVRAGRSLVALAVPVGLAATGGRNAGEVVVDLAIVAVVIALGVVSWVVTRWRLEGAVLRIDSGLIRRSSQRLPLSQVQAVDVVEPGLARLLGLAEIRLRMASSDGKAGRLSYLRVVEAQQLRARLLALAHGLGGDTPEPPERVLIVVPPGRLVGSILLSTTGLTLEIIIVVLVALAGPDPSLAGVAFSGGLTSFIALGAALWRRLNSGYKLTVAEAGDGLRLRSGLLQTTAETIPVGRVQGLRLVEPLSWRPFGWCRLEADVAGKQRNRRENQAESRTMRAILPVGTRAQADWLIERILPGANVVRHRPPARARWKAPLRYRHLSWGANTRYAVTTSGRLRRTTDLVPLSKVQSIRLVEGPLQRPLGLATIHLDIAGRNVHAALRDRERSECDSLMDTLPPACRAARRTAPAVTSP
jgi:putative membrane protein